MTIGDLNHWKEKFTIVQIGKSRGGSGQGLHLGPVHLGHRYCIFKRESKTGSGGFKSGVQEAESHERQMLKVISLQVASKIVTLDKIVKGRKRMEKRPRAEG